MIKKIFNHQTKSITFAAILLAVFNLINGVLALFRERFLASRFGASHVSDIFFAAFRIPDFIYGILIAGGVISVFLPIFSEYYNKDKEKGWYFTNVVLNCFLVLLFFLCLFFLIFTPFFIKFIAPGFNEESRAQLILLTRIMLLSPLFFVISSVFSGVLHYFNRFLIYSIAPLLYNLSIIAGILFFYPLFGLKGLGYGVVLGAALHFCIQVPSAILVGFKYQPVLDFKLAGLKKIFKLMIPRIIGSAADDLNLIIMTAIASTLVPGSISIFNYSNNLQRFPITLIGVSFATAIFPMLTKTWAAGQKKKFVENFFLSFRQILFLIIPISLLMFLLRAQLVRIILGTGRFDWLATRLTAASFGLLSFGIFAFCLIPLIARAFFSFQDTKTPVTIGIISIVLNIILSFLFIWILGFQNVFQDFIVIFLKLQGIKNIQVIGLPLALFFSGGFNVILLFIFLYKKIIKADFTITSLLKIKTKELYTSVARILISSILMAFQSYIILQIVAPFVNMQTFFGVFFQAAIAALFGFFVYVLINYFLKSPELKTLKFSKIIRLKQFTP